MTYGPGYGPIQPSLYSALDHLPACVLPRPDGPGCAKVREQFGLCPDHDGWCAPGCPVTGGGWPQTCGDDPEGGDA
jgi:hypothetical protein